jgi:hypothetical protein
MKLRHYEDIITYGGIMTAESRERLARIPCPKRIAGHQAPKDLNALTMEQLISLWSIPDEKSIPSDSLAAVFGYHANPRRCERKERLIRRHARHVRIGKAVGWCNFIQSELLRIKEMWSRCEVPIEALDRQAGVEQLNFGFFSIIDAYAQRQHISDPDEVLKVQWMKVWQSLLKDAETYKYKRRKDKLIEMQFKRTTP